MSASLVSTEPKRPTTDLVELDVLARVASDLAKDPRFMQDLVTRPHPLLVSIKRGSSLTLVAPACVWDRGRDVLKPFAERFAEGGALLILLGRPAEPDLSQAMNLGLASLLPDDPSSEELYVAVQRSLDLLEARDRAERRGKWLRRYRYELGELVNIARAMTTERSVDKLFSVILEKSRYVTDADAGSLYVVEGDDRDRHLRFKLTQNHSVSFDWREFTMPISNRSISGTVALSCKPLNIPDVYELPPGSSFHFDRSFDERIGYRTKSMLVAPLVSQQGEVIGVIQLINKKRDPEKKLLTDRDVQEQVVSFDERSEELLGMVAAQAGISLENAILYDEIRRLFEGFVKASVEAIESRDPTTSGHSRRVADLTVELAKVVDHESHGPYKDAFFSREDLRELEYASLLHDFGKIGVRERVLVKAKKLYDEALDAIRRRFDYVAKCCETDVLCRKITVLERGGSSDDLTRLDEELLARKAELEKSYGTILSANEPSVLAQGDFDRISEISKETYVDLRGDVQRLLTDEEVEALSVRRGSLTTQEFDEIRGHVSHTFRFLSQIPWGKALRRVPIIAGAHHERLNGSGYPNRLRAEEIPVQSKMMSISDIYDALTASDRPYKKAVPVERALEILDFSVKDQHVDADLVRIFREARVWELALHREPLSSK
jgi:HD-GYP domain-containing protein (c-di-GMP phosphodiesterase class II)